jgi:predicted SnoaL-like aldol condensation-catalyzing enzyme
MPNPFFRAGLAAGLSTLAGAAPASWPVSTAAATITSSDADKAAVLAFHEAAFGRLDLNEARRYLGASFIQHDPAIEDGVAGFTRYHQRLRATYPRYSYEIRRAVSSGGLVTVHALQRPNPWHRGDVQIHMYRVVNGALAEHWAVGNPIPATSLNANGLF